MNRIEWRTPSRPRNKALCSLCAGTWIAVSAFPAAADESPSATVQSAPSEPTAPTSPPPVPSPAVPSPAVPSPPVPSPPAPASTELVDATPASGAHAGNANAPAPKATDATVAIDSRRFVPDRRMAKLLERRTTLDLNVEVGLGRVFEADKTIGFARARAGILLVRAPFFEALGVTYEYSGLSPATFGLQAEVAWTGGFWGQGGALLDVDGRWGGMAAFGFAVLGVEGQLRDVENTGSAWALFGKLRIPLGIIGLAASAADAAAKEQALEEEMRAKQPEKTKENQPAKTE